ncbi:MAG: GH116 family glycosyl-hydrolase [Cecembia sp.]
MTSKNTHQNDIPNHDSEECVPGSGCCSSFEKTNQCLPVSSTGIQRRDFIKALGLAAGGVMLGFPAFGKQTSAAYQIPIDKGLTEEWFEKLYQRGEPEVYKGKDLAYIGMPVGGLCTGTVYIGGDGKLWLWDIFNRQKEGVKSVTHDDWHGQRVRPRDGANYIFPMSPEYPFAQGFGLRISQGNKSWERSLDFKGFEDISFKAQYPIAEISYRDSQMPIEVDLQAFSPFIPLDVKNSSNPAAFMHFTITNTSKEEVKAELSGWLENAILRFTKDAEETELSNSIEKESGNTVLTCSARSKNIHNFSTTIVQNQRDFGTMSLMLIGNDSSTVGSAEIPVKSNLLFPENTTETATAEFGEQLCGGVSKTVRLNPGESQKITFIISWHFPNIELPQNDRSTGENKGRHYTNHFDDSREVAMELAANYQKLSYLTNLWREAFYENSSLPHWFLNRTFINTSILATETCFIFKDGRFWAWEGIGCCPGTCTHVWHYAQAIGRLFPELEKNLREKTDFAVMDRSSGGIDFRGGLAWRNAADGQAGVVLRAYRDYQMSEDDTFLKNNWDNIKLALKYLIDLDKEYGETANGMIYGEQHNTLDAEWFGYIPAITSLYLAALAAAVEMARATGDFSSEKEYLSILESGRKNIESLFNGEYFIQEEDPDHLEAIGIGKGCYIDQVFGQGWAFQLNLGRLYNKEMIQSSLDSLWKYNFVPDMGPLRDSLPPQIAGRPYAIHGDSGLVMCTWPLGGKREDWQRHWQFGYFNECMTGFEYQAASHMIWEDKLDEGLSIIKAIHERYGAAKRNPYNEIECSDHYSRAMASYGAFIAACGFSYNGPKRQLGFAPKIGPNDFSAAFTSAEGWGSLAQTRKSSEQVNKIHIRYGKLKLKEITLELPEGKKVMNAKVDINGNEINALAQQSTGKTIISFNQVDLKENDTISMRISY